MYNDNTWREQGNTETCENNSVTVANCARRFLLLDVKVCLHQERYGTEILIEFLFRDGTASWVRTVNGTDKYVNETSETIFLQNAEHRATGRSVAKARPRLKLALTLSPISIPVRERKWIDINPQRSRQDCFDCCDMIHQFFEKMMEQYDLTILWKNSRQHFDGTSQWPINDWISCLAKGGGPKKVFNIARTLTLPNTSCISEQFRDIEDVISLILHCKTMYCYRRTSPSTSITSGI